MPLLGKLLSSENIDVLIPVVGTLQECASEVCTYDREYTLSKYLNFELVIS